MTDDDRTGTERHGSRTDPETRGAAPDIDQDNDDAADAGESGVRGSGGGDAGSPGGMGGVRGGVANPDHRPNGGVSPIQNDGED